MQLANQVFSGRAGDYVKFRTDYPDSLKTYLEKEVKISSTHTIADIGSGTGLLAKWFLELDAKVYGVEPNEDMRKEGEKNLATFKNFVSVVGSAEETSLEDHSVDWIAAGNAFHWFHHERAKVEFQRILKANGHVLLVRTDWKVFPAERMKEYDRIIMKYCVGRGGVVTDQKLEKEKIVQFFHKHKRISLGESEVSYTFEQLKGRFLSTSFSPKRGHPEHDLAMKELEALFHTFQKNGSFSFGVITTVDFGSF